MVGTIHIGIDSCLAVHTKKPSPMDYGSIDRRRSNDGALVTTGGRKRTGHETINCTIDHFSIACASGVIVLVRICVIVCESITLI